MRRILIIGQSGTGKSTLASMLSDGLNLPWHNGDSMWSMQGGVKRTPDEFKQHVDETIAKPSWIIDSNYVVANPKALAAADTLIWLDYPTVCTAYRYMKRSAARLLDGETIFGEKRPPTATFTDIAKDIYWSGCSFMRRQTGLSKTFSPIFAHPEAYPNLHTLRLTGPGQTRTMLATFGLAAKPTARQRRDARNVMPQP